MTHDPCRAQRALVPHFPLVLPAFEGIALIALGLAAAEAELQFDPAFTEVECERYQGEPFLLHGHEDLADLALMQEQLTRARRLVVEASF